jgi:hypothetical protein
MMGIVASYVDSDGGCDHAIAQQVEHGTEGTKV